jgi:glycosyltransferase involved in cell wall biosynthesis
MERALSRSGIDVTTLTTDHDMWDESSVSDRMPAIANGCRRVYARKWITPYKVAPGLALYLARHIRNYDVVHIHALFSFASTVAAWIARFSGVPYIVRPVGTLNAYGLAKRRRRMKRLSIALIERSILRHASAIHFTSQAELDEARASGLVFAPTTIPLGVEADDAKPADTAEAAISLPAGLLVVLFLSRLDPKKNLEVLIDAFASSPQLQQRAVLLIAGSGDRTYVDTLKRRAGALGGTEHIVWLGHVSGGFKRAAFAAADVFVLPSLSENFGIAAVEALRASVPCVLSSEVAIAGEIEKAGCGLSIRPDTSAVASALQRLLFDDSLRMCMAKKAREFAEREYSSETMAKRLIELYDDVRSK